MYLFKKPNHERISEFIESHLGSNSRIPRLVQRGMETTHQVSLLTTTASISDRAKPLSIQQSEHCANGGITGLKWTPKTGPVNKV